MNSKKSGAGVQLLPLRGIGEVMPGDDLAALLTACLQAHCVSAGDIVVIAQKIVSKAENRYVDLAAVTPSAQALQLAEATGKDARLVELILSQSKRVVRYRQNVLIVEHKLGFVHANAGIDHSNIPRNNRSERALLLPEDPDASAAQLQARLSPGLGVNLGVIINDSAGRAWRNGVTGIAIGAAGMPCLLDLRGVHDRHGNPLRVTEVGIADEIAAAASLVMGQAAQGIPAVLVKGLDLDGPANNASALIRDPVKDLFR
ncbi:MAG: coenzyme F420-0:L-glutamate ligase [Gammaproteobacteria bacterium]|nr:coenzyme F420-0:L-glutamate ligase [Gammaproteobacteria bacterium]MCY4283258.1 coenzyme F420-0:L-glutamate ligase [Gammaproteobacteria bacterium]